MTPEIAKAVDSYVSALTKLTAEHQKRASAKTVPTETLEKAASVLVETGFLSADRKADAVAILADPVKAIETLQNLAQKSALMLSGVSRDPRLAAGTPVSTESQTDGSTEKSAADQLWQERMNRFRNSSKK